MYCTKCGHPNDDNTSFCTNCGAPLGAEATNTQPQAEVQQPVQQPIQPQPIAQPKTTIPGRGLGIASMVLGIVSLALFCVVYLAIPCAIVGIILGIVGRNQAKKAGAPTGMATAGIICSSIALGIVIIAAIFAAVGIIAIGSNQDLLRELPNQGW